MNEGLGQNDSELAASDAAMRIVSARLAQARTLCGEDAAPELLAAVLAELGAETRTQYARGRAADF